MCDVARLSLRVLFAEYFNPKMLFALLGYLAREQLGAKVEVTVASSSLSAESIRAVVAHCSPQLVDAVQFVALSAGGKAGAQWFSGALRDRGGLRGYDYVEYGGAMFADQHYMSQLKDLISVSTRSDWTLIRFVYLDYI